MAHADGKSAEIRQTLHFIIGLVPRILKRKTAAPLANFAFESGRFWANPLG
jgi:hypothetical protein